MRIAARRFLTVILAAVFLGLQACASSTARPLAEEAVKAFHAQLDAGNFDGIWDAADDSFRKASSYDRYDAFIAAVHRKLGHVVKTSTVGWSIAYFNFQTRVVLQQQTQFEHGSGVETFTYVLKDNAARLSGYDIRSSDLITL